MGYGPLWGRYSLHYASPFVLSCFICEKRGRTKKRLDIVSLYDIINIVLRRGVAQFGRALRSGRRGRRFKSCRLDHMKAPLKPEPLRFGRQWCFCYKLCIYACSWAIRFQIQTGQENQKV